MLVDICGLSGDTPSISEKYTCELVDALLSGSHVSSTTILSQVYGVWNEAQSVVNRQPLDLWLDLRALNTSAGYRKQLARNSYTGNTLRQNKVISE